MIQHLSIGRPSLFHDNIIADFDSFVNSFLWNFTKILDSCKYGVYLCQLVISEFKVAEEFYICEYLLRTAGSYED